MSSLVTRTSIGVTAAVVAIAASFVGGMMFGHDEAEIAALERARTGATARAERLLLERQRLRSERDRLEARLAAQRAPAICPQQFVSTADSRLLPLFELEYPCGWHVLFDPRSSFSDEGRTGIRASIVLLSRLPISFAPRGGPPADIEVADWTDDPDTDGDDLPELTAWLDEERDRFTKRAEQRITAGGFNGHRLSGTIDNAGVPTDATVVLWEFPARDGTRHVVRVYSQAPSSEVLRALARLIASFRLRP
ncbi:MAG TPA: hypothetical protein VM600_01595 [Actinomycetota bacterium]|nr:hypothetical protein [Actinomycetota bacterium]